ncbi:MAG: hypothetical protein HQ471_00710 [Flavobacteriales bacterium]|jgi:hypothetical protein|nr:hypothetical protein [Flavobacteriales bacterium]
MQLTKEQITQLYTFTRQHFVEWYDLQTELVDHLANDIESILEENPLLTFNEAKNKSFAKFGIFGFSDVVAEKQKALHNKYWKLVWHFFKDYFKLPKIIVTFGLIGLVYKFLIAVPNLNIVISSLLLICILIPFILLIIKTNQSKKRQKITGKKWLFENIVNSFGGAFFMLQILFHIYQITNNHILLNSYSILLFSLFFVIVGFFFYIGFSLIPKKMSEIMSAEFPDYKLSLKA